MMKVFVLVLCMIFFVGCVEVYTEPVPIPTPEIVLSPEPTVAPVTTFVPTIEPAPTPTPEPEPVATPDPREVAVGYLLSRLSVEEKIGQLFMLRLPWQTLEVNDGVVNLFSDIPMGGVILFGDNVASREQVVGLTGDLQGLVDIPLFVAIDEEGGRVSRAGRLFAGGVTPSAYEIGLSLYSTSAAFENGLVIGQELKQLGVNINFAPVADIWSNPQNEVIGRRAFGREADIVAPLVEAFTFGLHEGGVMAVAKHFPGHGDTYEDSHYLLAVHHHDWERWVGFEALPFRSGIYAGVEGIMMGHIATPEITGDDLPATLSAFWHEVLRYDLGFDGLIITDALEMRALTDHFTCGEIAVMAFVAGADILLMPNNAREAYSAMLQAFEDGIFSEERLDESVRRILMNKLHL